MADYPRQKLLFYVAQDISSGIPEEIEDLVGYFATAREWIIAPPIFVNENGSTEQGFEAWVLGGMLEIYSAVLPSELPIDIDRKHLEEVSWLIEELRKFSEEKSLAFEFELEGVFVGSVQDGRVDKTLGQGFIGEWMRAIEG